MCCLGSVKAQVMHAGWAGGLPMCLGNEHLVFRIGVSSHDPESTISDTMQDYLLLLRRSTARKAFDEYTDMLASTFLP